MTWLVRNYQFHKERRIDLNELGVITFASKQELGLVHDKILAKALAAVEGLHVVRKVDDPNTTIPELRAVNARVPIVIEKPLVIVVEDVLPDEEVEDRRYLVDGKPYQNSPFEDELKDVPVEVIEAPKEITSEAENKLTGRGPKCNYTGSNVEDNKTLEDCKQLQEGMPKVKDDSELLPFCGCGKCGKRVTHKGNKFLRGHHLVKPKSNSDDKKSIQN